MPQDPRRPVLADPYAVDRARVFLDETVGRMGFDARVIVHDRETETVLEFVGVDAPKFAARKGAALDALQLLACRVASRAMGGERAALVVDADRWRERRERALTKQAEQLGAECVKRAKVIVMEPLPPRERRVVHMALARFPGVTTQSEGDGEERRIKIIPMPAPR
jgi:spoIIIJ-associated protein